MGQRKFLLPQRQMQLQGQENLEKARNVSYQHVDHFTRTTASRLQATSVLAGSKYQDPSDLGLRMIARAALPRSAEASDPHLLRNRSLSDGKFAARMRRSNSLILLCEGSAQPASPGATGGRRWAQGSTNHCHATSSASAAQWAESRARWKRQLFWAWLASRKQ